MKKTNTNLHLELTQELYRAFDFFNGHFAKGILEKPVITIASAGGRKAHGWFCHSIWGSLKDANKKMHEINICAESLKDGVNQTMDTLLHEMAHLYNFQKNGKVVDCTEQQRHNQIFQKTAQMFGLSVTSSKQFGFGHTELTDATKDIINNKMKFNVELFDLYRKQYNAIKDAKDKKKKERKMAPVMIGTEMKDTIEKESKRLGCDQKVLTETAIKYYLHILNTKPNSIPKEFRIKTNKNEKK